MRIFDPKAGRTFLLRECRTLSAMDGHVPIQPPYARYWLALYAPTGEAIVGDEAFADYAQVTALAEDLQLDAARARIFRPLTPSRAAERPVARDPLVLAAEAIAQDAGFDLCEVRCAWDGTVIDTVSLDERYGGAAKGRGIWYHGTSIRNKAPVLSQGLIPDPKKRAWAADPSAGINRASRKSIGGIYVTQNLVTATSSAGNAGNRGDGKLLVIMDLQPRSFTSDEDDYTWNATPTGFTSESLIGRAYWRLKMGDKLDDERKKYAEAVVASFTGKRPDADVRAIDRIRAVAAKGFDVAVTRQASHVDRASMSRGYFRAHEDDDRSVELPPMPDVPKPEDAERAFTAYMDELTRAAKSAAGREGVNPTARLLDPVRYSGKNRIVCVVEIVPVADAERTRIKAMYGGIAPYEAIRVLHGTPPPDFVKQWNARIGDVWYVGKDGELTNPDKKPLAAESAKPVHRRLRWHRPLRTTAAEPRSRPSPHETPAPKPLPSTTSDPWPQRFDPLNKPVDVRPRSERLLFLPGRKRRRVDEAKTEQVEIRDPRKPDEVAATIRLLVDPTAAELASYCKRQTKRDQGMVVRGLVGDDHAYFWPAYEAVHANIFPALGLPYTADARIDVNADEQNAGRYYVAAGSKRYFDVVRRCVRGIEDSSETGGVVEHVVDEGDATKPADHGAAHGLVGFIKSNMAAQYLAQVVRPIALYKARGTYDRQKAPKLAMHLVMAAGQKAGGGGGRPWHEKYTPKTREAAEVLVRNAAEKDAHAGKADHTLPKKYRPGFKGYNE